MLAVCLPSLSCGTLAPLALAWALSAYNLLQMMMLDREK